MLLGQMRRGAVSVVPGCEILSFSFRFFYLVPLLFLLLVWVGGI